MLSMFRQILNTDHVLFPIVRRVPVLAPTAEAWNGAPSKDKLVYEIVLRNESDRQIYGRNCFDSPAGHHHPWPRSSQSARWHHCAYRHLRKRGCVDLFSAGHGSSLDCQKRLGLILLSLSMFGSLLFGLYHHFLLAVSPDHVHAQPTTPWEMTFVLTACGLLLTEAIGTYMGFHFLRFHGATQ